MRQGREARAAARIVIDTPDVIVGADLAERLRRYASRLEPNGADACTVAALAPPDASRLRELLERVRVWAEFWEIDETPVALGGRSYVLRTQAALAWTEL